MSSIVPLEAAPAPSAGIELVVWKWVVIISVVAVVTLYVVKRIADVVVKRKTDAAIREALGDEPDQDGDDMKGAGSGRGGHKRT